MSEGHLTDEDRQIIQSWKIGSNATLSLSRLKELLDVIERNCQWPDFCIDYELATDNDVLVIKFYYSTGGWSGHEDLISELEGTFFWMFCWEQSRRGGHYIFEIKPEDWKDEPKPKADEGE